MNRNPLTSVLHRALIHGAALATVIATIGLAAVASAEPAGPKMGTFTMEDVRRVQQAEALLPQFDPATQCGNWEEHVIESDPGRPLTPTLASDDDDTAHYMRGRTLILHVFISHDGGTWTEAERNAAGVKARDAKEFYLNHAPAAANISFDFEGQTDYWFYEVTVPYNIPYDGLANSMIYDAIDLIGFSDSDGDGKNTDEISLWHQNWGGGWDNVLVCYEPDVGGRSWASYGTATTKLYTNAGHTVWRHEWGHLYGACDEYVEGGQCNGGVDCGACQSSYLSSTINNGNCDLTACPSDVTCVMRNNVDAICNYTLNHWAWVDSDSDGLLNTVKRRTTGSTFVNIYDLFYNGWFYWNNTGNGMSVRQSTESWSVIGLRSPSTTDYDLYVYGDNNHNYQYASSGWSSAYIDFVVGDYNHSNVGNEHIEVRKFGGGSDNYNLTWESGTSMLYPDGVARAGNWYGYNTVRVWDVPLFAGETITFTLDITGGSIDLGMGLFKSNGTKYFAGRSAAVASDDGGGVGATESFTYTVPADDVYGLVVWGNSTVDGTFTIQIGPAPYTLSEAASFISSLDLRLFNYDPVAGYWAFAGTQPASGTDVRLELYAESTYQTLLASSDYSGSSMDFVAVDYNHASSASDYLRVIRKSGTGSHRTEWEQGADISTGIASGGLTSTDLGEMWDVNLAGGTSYFFRQYHGGTTFNTGLYLFASNDGDYYKERAAFAAASNAHPPGDGGEWFSYAAPASDWYGMLLMANDETSGSYSIWHGPRRTMTEDVRYAESSDVMFGTATTTNSYWTAFGVRPSAGEAASVWLYGDNAYTIGTLKADDQWSSGVRYVVGDYNHSPTGVFYPRFYRASGGGVMDAEWEQGAEWVGFVPGGMTVSDRTWPAGDVVETFDLYVDGGATGGRMVAIMVEILSGDLDLGIELFRSNGAEYYARRGQGVASADAQGVGGTEEMVYYMTVNDYLGLVVFNKNDNGGTYRIRVWDAFALPVADRGLPATLSLASAPNPFHGATTLTWTLPREDRVSLRLYDVQGREVRAFADGTMPAGEYRSAWDGRDETGRALPAGVYLARLRAGGEQRQLKIVIGN